MLARLSGMVFMGYRLGPLLKRTGKEILDDGVTTLAAQTAYYFFFSLFPLLLFIAPLLTLIVDQETLLRFTVDHLRTALPGAAVEPVSMILRDVILVKDAPGLISIGLLFAAWSGSNIFGALMNALNTAYDVEEQRPFVRRTLIRLAMLVVGGIVMITATFVMLGGEDLARMVGSFVGASDAAVTVWSWVQFPVAFAFVVLLAYLTFKILPNVQQSNKHLVIAATVTATLWICATLLFRLYVQRFPPNPAYGLIGGIMILLTWMYVTMFVVLAGGELASEMHQGTGSLDPPRGATYFGRVVTGEHPGRASISNTG